MNAPVEAEAAPRGGVRNNQVSDAAHQQQVAG